MANYYYLMNKEEKVLLFKRDPGSVRGIVF